MAQVPYDVAEAFNRGEKARRGEFCSTGDTLTSYRLQLAHREDGRIVVDVDWEEARKISATTARHVKAARTTLDTEWTDHQGERSRTMADVIAANEAAGQHFFEPGAMRFFRSKIESELIGDLFVTSEQFEDSRGNRDARKYTIRRVYPNGHVGTASEFQAFPSFAEAVDAIGEFAS